MRKLVLGAAAFALVACGGGGSKGSSTSNFFGLYTGTADVFAPGNATATPNTNDADTAGVVQRSGTFAFDVQRITTVGAEPDHLTGKVRADGTITNAKLEYIDGDGVTGATITLNGTGTLTQTASSTTVSFTFPQAPDQRRYVLTLGSTT